ncbi:uncharacterized protein LOC128169897, partial [Crassostrea angulata]|uniref:uncharacterized protein LOC128169897 n=1 Tax=Magallana angulata TaxID=2784310 RepID=UPI0022B1B938
MGYVDVCPNTEAGIKTASKRLDCKNDTYNNSQYMCLPNEEKSSLVEFCFPGRMGIELKGHCLQVSLGGVTRHDCSRFSHGCPKDNFHKYNAYKYKACQQINKQRRCYIADPSCQPGVPNKTESGSIATNQTESGSIATNQTESGSIATNQTESGSIAIYAGIGSAGLVLIVIVIACIVRYIRNKE